MADDRPNENWTIKPELGELLAKILARARDDAMREAAEQVQRARNQSAAQGGLRSSNFLRASSRGYLDSVRAAATRGRTEMLDAVREVYGEVDAEHASHVLSLVNDLIDGLVRAIGGQAQQLLAGRGFQLPSNVIESVVRSVDSEGLSLKRDASIAVEPLILRARLSAVPRHLRTAALAEGDTFDLFVSYAGEDDQPLVHPLVEELQRRGLKVWYAGQQLTMGDSLAEKINAGLARSRFGIVVLSRAFLGKRWPMIELQTLIAIAATVGRKKLLPIWHDVTLDELAVEVPTIVGLRGVPSTVGIRSLADEIVGGMR